LSGHEIALALLTILSAVSLYYVNRLKSKETKPKIYFGYTDKKKE